MFELLKLLEEGRGSIRNKRAIVPLIVSGVIEKEGNEYVVKDKTALAFYLAMEGIDERYLSKWLDWRAFEDFVGNIFSEAGFEVKRDVKLLTRGGFQIDLLAIDYPELALSVECKRWERGASLKEVAREHLERTVKLSEKWRLLFKTCVKRVVPVIVTLKGRRGLVEGVWVVPVKYIKGFLREVHQLSYDAYNFKPICNP